MLLIGGLAIGASACGSESAVTGQTATSLALDRRDARAGYPAEVAAAVEAFARVLAEGLGDPGARAVIHKALRESPLYSYKVVLSDFVRTPQAKPLLGAIVRRAGMSESDLAQLLEALPPMQVYVPYPPHRRSWRASDPIAVVAIVDDVSPLVARLSGGAEFPLDRRARTLDTPVPILLLGPRETFLSRPDAGLPRVRTDVIEEERARPALQECWEDCGEGGGGGGSPPSPYLWAVTLINAGVCDHVCWDTAEFELKGLYPPSPLGTEFYTPRVRCEGVAEYDVVNVAARCEGNNNRVHEYSPTEVPAVEVYVQETDGAFGGDDDQFRDFITPRPGYLVSPLWVTDNAEKQRQYWMNEVPEEYNCALATPPCPPRLSVILRWN
jgi:hypothetical protein